MPSQNMTHSTGGDAPFKQGPRDWLRQTAGAAAPPGGSAVREATSVGAMAASAGPPQARPAPSGGSAVREATSVGAIFSWPVRVYWEDTDAGGIVFYANYLKFFERSRTEWLRSLGIEQQRLKDSTGGIFVVAETSIRYHRPARLDDELIVTASLVETGRASMIIRQQALLKQSSQVHSPHACFAMARYGSAGFTAATCSPCAFPPPFLTA